MKSQDGSTNDAQKSQSLSQAEIFVHRHEERGRGQEPDESEPPKRKDGQKGEGLAADEYE